MCILDFCALLWHGFNITELWLLFFVATWKSTVVQVIEEHGIPFFAQKESKFKKYNFNTNLDTYFVSVFLLLKQVFKFLTPSMCKFDFCALLCQVWL